MSTSDVYFRRKKMSFRHILERRRFLNTINVLTRATLTLLCYSTRGVSISGYSSVIGGLIFAVNL